MRTARLKGVSASEVARAFDTHHVFPYGPQTYLIACNGKQFTSKFFLDLCRILTVHNGFTTTYHPQTKGQIGQLNWTVLSAQRTAIGSLLVIGTFIRLQSGLGTTRSRSSRPCLCHFNWFYPNLQDP